MMYDCIAPDRPLEQGDIIDDVSLFSLPDDLALTTNLKKESLHWLARVIVIAQSCDLVQGKGRRIVVAPVYVAREFIDKGLIRESVVRDQIRRGLVQLSESLIDFRDLHTGPVTLLMRLVADGKRVCRVVTHYREHLAQHFGVTFIAHRPARTVSH